jgi:hypothetical protein
MFLIRAMNSAKIQIDLSHLPIEMTYEEDFKIAIFVSPSECADARCQDGSSIEGGLRTSPCKRPVEFSDWFTCTAEDCAPTTSTERAVVRSLDEDSGLFEVDKHNLLNFTVFALEDVLMKVEVHLLSGLYLSSQLFFRNSTTVDVVGGGRARIERASIPAKRSLSKATSFEQKLVPKEYFFISTYRRGYADEISAPLNLPPYFKEFQKGRVLTSFNASGDANWIPSVLDKLDPEKGYPQYYQSALPPASKGVDWWKNDAEGASPCRTGSHVGDIEHYRETFQDEATAMEDQAVVLPYLPFFSNCREFDSYIPIFEILEGQECELPSLADEEYGGSSWWRREFAPMVHPDDFYAVQFWDFFAKMLFDDRGEHWSMPTSDWCERNIQCSFEEDLFENRDSTPRWFEAGGGTLFDFYSFPIEFSTDYLDASTCEKQSFIHSKSGEDFVSVDLAPEEGCGEEGMIPRDMTLNIFYQFVHFDHYIETPLDTNEIAWKKRIIKAELVLDNCDDNVNNTDYNLQTKFIPLDFKGLMIEFAFEFWDYFFLFVFIGVFTVLVAAIFYLVVRLTTRLRRPPKFQFWPFIIIIAPGPIYGLSLACVPLMLLLFLVDVVLRPELWGTDSAFSSLLGTMQPGFEFSDEPEVDERMLNGRVGLAFFIIGSYMIYQGSRIFIPNRVSKREKQIERMRDKNASKETVWVPSLWKRSNMIFCSYMMAMVLVVIIEISFHPDFGEYIWTAILLLKILAMALEAIVDGFLKEHLLICPIMTSYSLIAGVVTFGADDFADFLLSYLVEFCFILVERVYIDPGLGDLMDTGRTVVAHVSRFVRKKLNIKNKSKLEIDVFVLDADGKATLKKRDIEEMQANEGSETVEPIVDAFTGYANETLALFYQPVLVGVFLIWFRDPVYIADEYGINESEMVLYFTFAAVIMWFQMAADVFIQNVQELFHGWKIYDYLVYTRYRFMQRECRWKGLEDSLDECIEEGMRTLDQMCFSSQFYMMSTIHTTGVLFIVFSIETMLQTNYNMFADFALPILILYVLACCYFVKKLSIWCALKADLWRIKHSNTNWHTKDGGDDDDFNLPGWDEIGKIEGASHEAYLMNQRITSETFRYKFLNYNRAWLVSQLPSILTPRTLKRSRPYLVQQMAKILGSVNPDVSSDSDSDDDGKPKFPPVSLSAASRNIIRMWLAQARRRQRLHEAVQPLINAERKNECEQCLSRKGLQIELVIPLEKIGDRYEKEHKDDKEFDQMKWKEV